MDEQNQKVAKYYGETLQSSADLKTSACCSLESMPPHVRPIMGQIHPEVLDRFYGCGSPIPPAVDGLRVLDLGCGTGRDCYLFSSLVGPSGSVVGVDMTDEQLEVAKRHVDHHAEAFGHDASNVSFVKGNIQDLQSAGLKENEFDLVVSNCVLNLASDKAEVFREIARVLKPGGELYFSDVFTDKRVPEKYWQDEVLLGECLSGALYVEDFRRLVEDVFESQYFVLSAGPIELHDPDIVAKVGDITFYSITVRVINVPLEDREENYGHTVSYQGGIAGSESEFIFDQRFRFPVGRAIHVPGNVAEAIQGSRYAWAFRVSGSRDKHLGPFVTSETQILRAIEVSEGSSCSGSESSCGSESCCSS